MSEYFDRMASTWDQDPMKIERSELTAEYCKRASLKDTGHLLDFGGGTGLLSVCLRDVFDRITIVDTSSEMLRVAQEKIKEAQIPNISTQRIEQDLSEVVGSYSAIIALMTLHHIPDLDLFLNSAAKVLGSNGSLMIADLYKEDGSFHHNDRDFTGHNGFEVEALSAKLNRAGFKVVQVTDYYQIRRKIKSGEERTFPLFFLVAEKL
ncbi:class I SAM-dependent methyltransferase [Desulfoluna sp.]|uniref:class I SAM-dependent DNA methyltransferase n=1 Tax=Desulfoluna sp. TaxID=2045199 RepID=UPI00260B4BE9|nr:class I SAM-dependent methyltransferase [Desulfoluna sp.]